MNNWQYPDTTGWNEWQFQFDGHNFVSKVSPTADMMTSIRLAGDQAFIGMNIQCLTELIGLGKTLSEIKNELTYINQGGINAVIELV